MLRRNIASAGELDVFWYVYDDRPGAPTSRDVERLVQDGGKFTHVAHQPIVLGARPRDANRVALLERVGPDQVRRDLAGDDNQRD